MLLSPVYGFDADGDSGAVLEELMAILVRDDGSKFRLDAVLLPGKFWRRLNEVYADSFYSAMCDVGYWGGVVDDGCRRAGTEEGAELR